jgi:very-short-patch-repair endonuclease
VTSNADAIRSCESHAAGNHGIVPLSIALSEGLDNQAVHHLVSIGRWVRVFARAYRVAGAPDTWRSRLAAVNASIEGRFAFSHRTAGALLGLDPIAERDIEIISKTMPRLPGVRVHRIRGPWPQLLHAEGFPVTSAHRTILDLFAVKHHNMAELALEDALRKKMTTLDRLWDEYTKTCTHGRNGCRHFRLALLQRDDRDGTLQSRMESKLRRIIKHLPGEPAVPQVEVRTAGFRYFLDFAYPGVMLGIEAQSIRWHMGQAKFYYDLKRDRRLKRAGWTMLYFSMDDLLRRDEVAKEILDFRDSLQRAI